MGKKNKKGKTQRVDLTNSAYLRWLRAQRPDMRIFLALNEDEQETLAIIAENYLREMFGEAPAPAPQSEADRLQEESARTVERLLSGEDTPKTFAGATKARQNGKSLLGKLPDGAE